MFFGDYFLQEDVVYVVQREEFEVQEKQGLFFFFVSEVVVLQSQYREGGQYYRFQEEMLGGYAEEDGQQDERGNDVNVNFFGFFKLRNSEAIRDGIYDFFISFWLYRFIRNLFI